MKHTTDTYIVLMTPLPSGNYIYTAVDQRLCFSDERKALAKRDSLNAEWRKEQHP